MGKALMGTYTTPRAIELLDEVRSLRRRVAELEQALAQAQDTAREVRENASDDETITLDDRRAIRASA